MNITIISGRNLEPQLIKDWERIQGSNSILESPYFSPYFTQAVASVREDVFVAILEREGEVMGFFPFQREGNQGFPVGNMLSDYQGIIIHPSTQWDLGELLDACGLASWKFDHLVSSQDTFQDFCAHSDPSPFMDLSGGFQTYSHNRRINGTRQILKAACKYDKLERDFGKLRFVPKETDPQMLTQMMEWKSAQYIRSGTWDRFEIPWITNLLYMIHQTHEKNFSGALSVLYLEDKPLAIHFGMCTPQIWHYWFPTYSRDFRAYSPGILLLLEMARYAAQQGVHSFHLGKGLSKYKSQLMTDSDSLSSGEVQLRNCKRHVIS